MALLGRNLVHLWAHRLLPSSAGCYRWLAARSKDPVDVDERVLPVVAIVGRPNVGKSALFNKLVRAKEALVYDTPGDHVTRDYKEGIGRLVDLQFKVIDTSGLEPQLPSTSIQGRATPITAGVLSRAHIALLVLDARQGVVSQDYDIASWLRKVLHPKHQQVLVVANKAENQQARQGMSDTVNDAYGLGYGEPVAVSATTGEGFVDLFTAMQPVIDAKRQQLEEYYGVAAASDDDEDQGADASKAGPIKVAIMGLPNVGKSTLLNQLLQQQRCLTGPEPGLTRDAVHVQWEWQGRQFELVDTAGWIRPGQHGRFDEAGGDVARMTTLQGQRALGQVHVVLLLFDAAKAHAANGMLSRRELGLAGAALDEGKALLLVANKADLLTDEQRSSLLDSISGTLDRMFLVAGRLPTFAISALRGQGTDELMPAVVGAYDKWDSRAPTGKINYLVSRLAVSLVGTGGATGLDRVKYITQVKARPPTFVAMVNGTDDMPEASSRFMASRLRDVLDLQGVPLRVYFRYKNRKMSPGEKLAADRAKGVGEKRAAAARARERRKGGRGRRLAGA